jgi:energy-coupling factor transporter ATP-binding protein EcfA2
VIGIAIDGVAYTYPTGVRALDGVDLAVRPGETLAIIGQNGSGKSTLVRQLNGLLRPGQGRVLLDGAEVGRRHVAELARLVGLAFQDPDRQIFSGSAPSWTAGWPRRWRSSGWQARPT